MEDGERQGFVFVEDGDLPFGILTDGDLSIAQGIVWAVGVNLVDHFVGLDGQVFGKRARFLMGQDNIQVFGLDQRVVGIMYAARLHCETAVEIFTKLWQVSIRSLHIRDVAQT